MGFQVHILLPYWQVSRSPPLSLYWFFFLKICRHKKPSAEECVKWLPRLSVLYSDDLLQKNKELGLGQYLLVVWAKVAPLPRHKDLLCWGSRFSSSSSFSTGSQSSLYTWYPRINDLTLNEANVNFSMFKWQLQSVVFALTSPSSETQGHLVGAGKRLNGEEKNSAEEKSTTRRRAPGDKVLTA